MIEEEEKLSDVSGDPNRHLDNNNPDKDDGEPANEQPEGSQPQQTTARIGLREFFLINQMNRQVKTIND